jgi:hypothetical protein
VAAPFGLHTAALASATAYATLRSALLLTSLRGLGVDLRRYFRVLAAPLVGAGFMVAVVLLVRLLLPLTSHVDHVVRDVVAGVLAYAGALLLFDRSLAREVSDILTAVLSRPSEARP